MSSKLHIWIFSYQNLEIPDNDDYEVTVLAPQYGSDGMYQNLVNNLGTNAVTELNSHMFVWKEAVLSDQPQVIIYADASLQVESDQLNETLQYAKTSLAQLVLLGAEDIDCASLLKINNTPLPIYQTSDARGYYAYMIKPLSASLLLEMARTSPDTVSNLIYKITTEQRALVYVNYPPLFYPTGVRSLYTRTCGSGSLSFYKGAWILFIILLFLIVLFFAVTDWRRRYVSKSDRSNLQPKSTSIYDLSESYNYSAPSASSSSYYREPEVSSSSSSSKVINKEKTLNHDKVYKVNNPSMFVKETITKGDTGTLICRGDVCYYA